MTMSRHAIERLWREVGLPEYFLGNDGSNTKLYALYEAIRADEALWVCKGCGTRKSLEQIKGEHPEAISCCPERKMVPAQAATLTGE